MATNDQDELEKIMSEIEDLQKEISPETSSSTSMSGPKSVPEEVQGVQDSETQEDASLEEMLGGLKEEPISETGLLAKVVSAMLSSNPMDEERSEDSMAQPKHDSGGEGTLSLTLTGNMKLKLKYEFEGQEVVISFAEQALQVQMTDGTEFKVPVYRASEGSNIKPFKKAV